MFGAQRPPWIDKRDFYRTPFNYCDRWCERCQLTHLCRVFKNEQKSRVRLIKEGKDPDSMESAFEMVAENFAKTMAMIKKDAEKMGINLDEIDDSDYQSPPHPEKFPLYNLAFKFMKRLEKILEDLRFVSEGADEKLMIENMEIISHYAPLVPGKIYRAFTSRLEEEEEKKQGIYIYDAETSAFIAINGLIAIAEALNKLVKHDPLRALRNRLRRLGKTSLGFAETIDLEFNLNII